MTYNIDESVHGNTGPSTEKVPSQLYQSEFRKYFSGHNYNVLRMQYDKDRPADTAYADNGKYYEISSAYKKNGERILKIKRLKDPKNPKDPVHEAPRPASQATRDSHLRTEKPERFLILDPKGNTLSSSLGKLKTDSSIKALHAKLQRHSDAWFINGFKNTPLAIYDTKTKKVVEVLYLDDNKYWQFALNNDSLNTNNQYANMFKVKPNNTVTESNAMACKFNKSVTELIETIVRQTILEMNQAVKYDPSIHKTIETGAIDYELDASGNIVYAMVPFKEESQSAVSVPFKIEYIESLLDEKLGSQTDLDSADQERISKFVNNVFTRSDSNQILKKVLVLNK